MNFYTAVSFVENSAVLSSFLSGTLVLIIGSILLPRYLKYLRRPKTVEFFDRNTGLKTIPASLESNGNFRFSFDPILKHRNGDSLMNGVHWQINFPSFVEVTVNPIRKDAVPGYQLLDDGTHNYYGKFQQQIFQNTTTELQYVFECSFSFEGIGEHLNRFPLLTWFSTEFGDYPRKLRRINDQGVIDYRTMDHIWVELENIN